MLLKQFWPARSQYKAFGHQTVEWRLNQENHVFLNLNSVPGAGGLRPHGNEPLSDADRASSWMENHTDQMRLLY